jgi:hypothetical protein
LKNSDAEANPITSDFGGPAGTFIGPHRPAGNRNPAGVFRIAIRSGHRMSMARGADGPTLHAPAAALANGALAHAFESDNLEKPSQGHASSGCGRRRRNLLAKSAPNFRHQCRPGAAREAANAGIWLC